MCQLRAKSGSARTETGYVPIYAPRHLHLNIELGFLILSASSVNMCSVSAFLMESFSSKNALNHRRPMAP